MLFRASIVQAVVRSSENMIAYNDIEYVDISLEFSVATVQFTDSILLTELELQEVARRLYSDFPQVNFAHGELENGSVEVLSVEVGTASTTSATINSHTTLAPVSFASTTATPTSLSPTTSELTDSYEEYGSGDSNIGSGSGSGDNSGSVVTYGPTAPGHYRFLLALQLSANLTEFESPAVTLSLRTRIAEVVVTSSNGNIGFSDVAYVTLNTDPISAMIQFRAESIFSEATLTYVANQILRRYPRMSVLDRVGSAVAIDVTSVSVIDSILDQRFTLTPSPTTQSPTLLPTLEPTAPPTSIPTVQPTPSPSTQSPTLPPSSMAPSTGSPSTVSPTLIPTQLPTTRPTNSPTHIPSFEPTSNQPTVPPSTRVPTQSPSTVQPTAVPASMSPTSLPSSGPTDTPSLQPTREPTSAAPTAIPSGYPTVAPTALPTPLPPPFCCHLIPGQCIPNSQVCDGVYDCMDGSDESTATCTNVHFTTESPVSFQPTTVETTSAPSRVPTTHAPTTQPSEAPTLIPTNTPTGVPTTHPSEVPTTLPSEVPTTLPPTLCDFDSNTSPTAHIAPECNDHQIGDQPWVNSRGHTCAAHVIFLWCVGGTYGRGWNQMWGTFEDYAANGFSAEQACCACGGGQVASASQSLSAAPTCAAIIATPAPTHEEVLSTLGQNIVGSSECNDMPRNWSSQGGFSCQAYVTFQFCTTDGRPGAGWNAAVWGTIEDYSVDGISALMACCGCGGGLRRAVTSATTSSTVRIPTGQPTTTPSLSPSITPTTSAPTFSAPTFSSTETAITTEEDLIIDYGSGNINDAAVDRDDVAANIFGPSATCAELANPSGPWQDQCLANIIVRYACPASCDTNEFSVEDYSRDQSDMLEQIYRTRCDSEQMTREICTGQPFAPLLCPVTCLSYTSTSPTLAPTIAPTQRPTYVPTINPTHGPSLAPTANCQSCTAGTEGVCIHPLGFCVPLNALTGTCPGVTTLCQDEGLQDGADNTPAITNTATTPPIDDEWLVCTTARLGDTSTISCGQQASIVSIADAIFGVRTQTGCANLSAHGGCNAALTHRVVNMLCVGLNVCTVESSVAVLGSPEGCPADADISLTVLARCRGIRPPTTAPTSEPTIFPTTRPSMFPTQVPTQNPTVHPTSSTEPTIAPSVSPTIFPTRSPTLSPTPIPHLPNCRVRESENAHRCVRCSNGAFLLDGICFEQCPTSHPLTGAVVFPDGCDDYPFNRECLTTITIDCTFTQIWGCECDPLGYGLTIPPRYHRCGPGCEACTVTSLPPPNGVNVVCQRCMPGRALVNGQCMSCSDQLPGCEQCSAQRGDASAGLLCYACQPGYYLHDGRCHASCADISGFPNAVDGRCIGDMRDTLCSDLTGSVTSTGPSAPSWFLQSVVDQCRICRVANGLQQVGCARCEPNYFYFERLNRCYATCDSFRNHIGVDGRCVNMAQVDLETVNCSTVVSMSNLVPNDCHTCDVYRESGGVTSVGCAQCRNGLYLHAGECWDSCAYFRGFVEGNDGRCRRPT